MHLNLAGLITISITLSLGLVGCFGMDGGSCSYEQGSFLTQIESKSDVNYTLDTMDNKTNPSPPAFISSFEIPISELDPDLLRSKYLIADVQYITSGACTPSHVINVERFTIGKLWLQADDEFYTKASYKVQQIQSCISNNLSQCSGIGLSQYSKDEMDAVQSIDADTFKGCSLDAIREYMPQLEGLPSNNYVVGCAATMGQNKKLPLYFEQSDGELVFRGVIF